MGRISKKLKTNFKTWGSQFRKEMAKAKKSFYIPKNVHAVSLASFAWPNEVIVSPAVQDAAGILVHTVQSEYQSAKTKIRVLLPRPLQKSKRYSVLYVLPVEPTDGVQWGDGLLDVKKVREHHQSAHRLMEELKIAHEYRDGPKREHSWHSGWLPEAVQMLVEKPKGQ